MRRRWAPLDAGQAVVVAHGKVLAIEGAEGTDAMLQRVAGLPGREAAGSARRRAGQGAQARPGAARRHAGDRPAHGRAAAAAGLAGVVVEAGARAGARPGRGRPRRRRGGLRPLWPASRRDLRAQRAASSATGRVIGRSRPSRRDAGDIEKGLAAVSAWRRYGTGASAVVVVRPTSWRSRRPRVRLPCSSVRRAAAVGRARRKAGVLVRRAEDARTEAGVLEATPRPGGGAGAGGRGRGRHRGRARGLRGGRAGWRTPWPVPGAVRGIMREHRSAEADCP